MYTAKENRYENMQFNYCGNSGLKLPMISLGLWHNFGYGSSFQNMENMCHTAFDNGITVFDIANNYGAPEGAAEENFGKILSNGFIQYRDEMIITTKAGYYMHKGPYGDWGSRKYLISSLNASLKRLGIEYVDIFYHHRYDPNTPMEETAYALKQIVDSGKALYVGISNYNKEQTIQMAKLLKESHTPFIINQIRYSIFDRTIEENGLKDYASKHGIGLTTFSPLAQGLLTDRYLNGIPKDSRIITDGRFLHEKDVNDKLEKIKKLNEIAQSRGQSLAQMALSWILRDGDITSVLIGASSPEQIIDNLGILHAPKFTEEELQKIEEISK